MRVLVTGNNGYIGPKVERLLLERGHTVVGLDTDYFEGCKFQDYSANHSQIVRDIREVREEDLEGIEGIIHLAALSNDPMGALDESLTDDINYRSTVRLAELAKPAGVRRFVYASSCSLYGVAGDSALTETAAQNPVTAYAKSKVHSEQALDRLADQNFSPVYMRNATAFGVSPRLRVDLVLNNLVGWAVTTGKIRIMSDGSPWRPLVHIEDIALAAVCALEAPQDKVHNQAFNVGRRDCNYQVRGIAEMVQHVVPGCDLEFTNEHGSDSRTYNVNFDKIHETLPGFAPKWDLESGVRELVDAYRKHDLTLAAFEGHRYIRLKQLERLSAQGQLNEKLYWR